MHARSALFDLYGDHLRRRGGSAPVAALVRLMAPLDIAAPAVRTAISRMVRQGWLSPMALRGARGYALTERAHRRLDDAAARIYRTRDLQWDGFWDLLVVDPVGDRSARERVRSGLSFLGYAPLTDSTWISPFASPEVDAVLKSEKASATHFEARDGDPRLRANLAWDLDALGAAYSTWHREAAALVQAPRFGVDFGSADEEAFAVRSHLVHEWRKFLFIDPGLPAELLPSDWPGHTAAAFFAEEASRLLPAASRFVDLALEQALTQNHATASRTDRPNQSGDPT